VKTLVTGGAGFIGSHIVDSLLKMGHDVVILDDLSGGFKENVDSRAILIIGSITDASRIDRLFERYSFDYVFHTAAYAAEGLSHFIRNYNYTNNVVGSTNLINAAVRNKCKCFVFTSSIAVYGEGQTPMLESMTPVPEDPYGIAKYAVELDLAAAKRMFDLDYIIFRPHNVYGERQNIGDPYRNVIGIFMNQIMQKQPCTIFGNGNQTRAFTHVSDVAPIIASSVFNEEAYNQVFNIGADIPYTVNQLNDEVLKAMCKRIGFFTTVPNTVHLPPRKEVLHAFSDHSKLRKMFSVDTAVQLPEGLDRMAEWAVAVGARKGKPFAKIEIEEGLPESWRQLQNC
jgi:UDP-glucose 4-epimerase